MWEEVHSMHAHRLNGKRERVVSLLWDHKVVIDVEIGKDKAMLKLTEYIAMKSVIELKKSTK
jgi:hypothetical protein